MVSCVFQAIYWFYFSCQLLLEYAYLLDGHYNCLLETFRLPILFQPYFLSSKTRSVFTYFMYPSRLIWSHNDVFLTLIVLKIHIKSHILVLSNSLEIIYELLFFTGLSEAFHLFMMILIVFYSTIRHRKLIRVNFC